MNRFSLMPDHYVHCFIPTSEYVQLISIAALAQLHEVHPMPIRPITESFSDYYYRYVCCLFVSACLCVFLHSRGMPKFPFMPKWQRHKHRWFFYSFNYVWRTYYFYFGSADHEWHKNTVGCNEITSQK